MATRMNISVPDELAEQVRAYDLLTSAICQDALSKAVNEAKKKERIMSDMDAVVERLRGTATEADRRKHEEGRLDGIRWAKYTATASDLEAMAGVDVYNMEWDEDTTLPAFMEAKDRQSYTKIYIDPDDTYWDGFVEGAEEIWNAVSDKL